MPPARHLFVCTNVRPVGGRPACGARGGEALVEAVTEAVFRRGAAARIAVTTCGCLGPCFDGPNAVEYPAGRWWSGLGVEDADAIAAVLDGEEAPAALAAKLRDDRD